MVRRGDPGTLLPSFHWNAAGPYKVCRVLSLRCIKFRLGRLYRLYEFMHISLYDITARTLTGLRCILSACDYSLDPFYQRLPLCSIHGVLAYRYQDSGEYNHVHFVPRGFPLTTLPVRVSAKAMGSNSSSKAATMIRAKLILCESSLALFFRAIRTQLDRKTER